MIYINEAKQKLTELIKIESVEATPSQNAPFGVKVRESLDYMLSLASALDFEPVDVDGYAGYCELKGSGLGSVGVLTHLDVVPLGDGWSRSQGECSDGKIFGRGAIDNKGPTLACLYALKRIKDEKISLSKTIRLIWGCNEETGNKCMDYYKSKYPDPDISFSPDGDFPLISCEKTIMHLGADIKVDYPVLKKLNSGERANVVPAKSILVLSGTVNTAVTKILSDNPGLGILDVLANGDLQITSHGKAAHAMLAPKGDNAVWKSLKILSSLPDCPESLTSIARFADTDALNKTGLYCKDDLSGEQTINLGVVNLCGDIIKTVFDFRCPISQDINKIKSTLSNILGCEIKTLYHAPYLYAAPDSFLVMSLNKVYKAVTAKEPEYIISGGGTYARKMKNCVAFGPQVKEIDNRLHDSDEFITEAQFEELFEIYYRALIELAE